MYSLPAEERTHVVRQIERTQLYRDKNSKLRFYSPILPVESFRQEAKKHLENILVSIKAKNKVMTRNDNVTKSAHGNNHKVQLTPRGQLHNETIYGSSKRYVAKMEKVGASFTEEKISTVASPGIRIALSKRLMEYGGNPKKAFTGANSLDKNPIILESSGSPVPSIVKTVATETIYTIRKEINKDLKIDKVVDKHIREILKARLDEYGGSAEKAFSNLDDNPIWLNKDKGIAIKRVTISGVNNAVALHDKRDYKGDVILDENDMTMPADFVSTSNNHHIAIFRDAEGRLQEQAVSFFEAVSRANLGQPIIDTQYRKEDGWEFMFTMKRNEYFVLPGNDGFDPQEIDLLNPDNYPLISPHLFRVQKLASKYYVFRHHLETNVEDDAKLRGTAWERIRNIEKLKSVVKVRINHLGQIVDVGEY